MTWMTPHVPYAPERPYWLKVTSSGFFKSFLLVYFVLNVGLLIDLEAVQTELYTPLNSTLIGFARWLGASITLVAGSLLIFESQTVMVRRGIGRVLMSVVVLCPLAGASAVLFEHLAWRVEEAWAFRHLSSDKHNWNMRVAGLYRGGSYNDIYEATVRRWRGDPLDFPISQADYERFPDAHLRNIELCYAVSYQQAGTAIRVWRPNRPLRGELRLRPCRG